MSFFAGYNDDAESSDDEELETTTPQVEEPESKNEEKESDPENVENQIQAYKAPKPTKASEKKLQKLRTQAQITEQTTTDVMDQITDRKQVVAQLKESFGWAPPNLMDEKAFPALKSVINHPVLSPFLFSTNQGVLGMSSSLVGIAFCRDVLDQCIRISGGGTTEIAGELAKIGIGIQKSLQSLAAQMYQFASCFAEASRSCGEIRFLLQYEGDVTTMIDQLKECSEAIAATNTEVQSNRKEAMAEVLSALEWMHKELMDDKIIEHKSAAVDTAMEKFSLKEQVWKEAHHRWHEKMQEFEGQLAGLKEESKANARWIKKVLPILEKEMGSGTDRIKVLETRMVQLREKKEAEIKALEKQQTSEVTALEKYSQERQIAAEGFYRENYEKEVEHFRNREDGNDQQRKERRLALDREREKRMSLLANSDRQMRERFEQQTANRLVSIQDDERQRMVELKRMEADNLAELTRSKQATEASMRQQYAAQERIQNKRLEAVNDRLLKLDYLEQNASSGRRYEYSSTRTTGALWWKKTYRTRHVVETPDYQSEYRRMGNSKRSEANSLNQQMQSLQAHKQRQMQDLNSNHQNLVARAGQETDARRRREQEMTMRREGELKKQAALQRQQMHEIAQQRQLALQQQHAQLKQSLDNDEDRDNARLAADKKLMHAKMDQLKVEMIDRTAAIRDESNAQITEVRSRFRTMEDHLKLRYEEFDLSIKEQTANLKARNKEIEDQRADRDARLKAIKTSTAEFEDKIKEQKALKTTVDEKKAHMENMLEQLNKRRDEFDALVDDVGGKFGATRDTFGIMMRQLQCLRRQTEVLGMYTESLAGSFTALQKTFVSERFLEGVKSIKKPELQRRALQDLMKELQTSTMIAQGAIVQPVQALINQNLRKLATSRPSQAALIQPPID